MTTVADARILVSFEDAFKNCTRLEVRELDGYCEALFTLKEHDGYVRTLLTLEILCGLEFMQYLNAKLLKLEAHHASNYEDLGYLDGTIVRVKVGSQLGTPIDLTLTNADD